MKTTAVPAAAALLLASPLFATEVEPVVVTPTRTATTADESLASVTVITRETIEQSQARSVEDVLQGVAGITISNNGGPGKETSLFLRGTESDHLVVLIDGVKVGSATTGATAFQHIPIESIERIEVVRGPRSSLYGSEAIGGVIQIFTRKGGGPIRPFFSIGGGSDNTVDGSAGVSGGGERGWFGLSASSMDTDGFNACDGEPSVGGCFVNEPDEDGYQSRSGSARAGYRFENGTEADVHWLRGEDDTEFDGSFVNRSESVQEVVGAGLRFSLAEAWQPSLKAGRSRDESDNFLDGVFRSRFDTERDTLSLQNDFAFAADQLLTLGLDYQEDRVDSTTEYVVDSRENRAAFLQYQAGFGRQDVQLALRRDDNEQFGNHDTGNAAWGLALGGGMRFTASYGTAFKAPTFNELYFPGYGNPDLKPERSRTTEFGLSGKTGGGRWSLNLFQTDIDQLIAFDAATYAPNNIDEARIRGLEATLATRIVGWQLTTHLTLLEPENRGSGVNRGNLLPRRAEQALRLDLDRGFGRWRLGSTVLAEGRRYDDLANTRRLGGYAVVDLRTEYRFDERWRLQARLENLLDKEYETAAFFNQPGRSLFFTLRYQG